MAAKNPLDTDFRFRDASRPLPLQIESGREFTTKLAKVKIIILLLSP